MFLAVNWGNAIIITLVGFGIVFVVLTFLVFIIQLFGKVMAPKANIKVSHSPNENNIQNSEQKVIIPALDSAAIATALHLYFEDIHDEESHNITIRNIERRYSPWNSKIYGLNNNFQR